MLMKCPIVTTGGDFRVPWFHQPASALCYTSLIALQTYAPFGRRIAYSGYPTIAQEGGGDYL